MGLFDRFLRKDSGPAQGEQRYAIDQWISDYLMPATEQFYYGGRGYPYGNLTQTWSADRSHEISGTLPSYAAAVRQCPPAFAAQQVRATVMSQARFVFRSLPHSPGTPRKQFGSRALAPLESPWPGCTTGELLSRMEWHAGLAGNAFLYRQPGRLRLLRPDWVIVVYGSEQEPDDAMHALDGELVGYVYVNGGLYSGNRPVTLLPSDVAHWCPLPDPEMAHIGMSWITPAVRDISGDRATSEHKLKFFANSATPNLVVTGITAANRDQFRDIVDQLEEQHSGLRNAYKTLYLTAGADATVVGSDLRQLDFKNVQNAGENRIAFLSRVPSALLGIAEGLKGSSLNAGNFKMAQRSFSDAWLQPTLQGLCGAVSPLIDVPPGAELWFDTVDVGLLRDDGKDAAQIEEIKARTITILVREGFTPESAIAAVQGQNMNLLKHTGLVSVQLQEPGADPGGGHYVPVGTGPKAPPGE